MYLTTSLNGVPTIQRDGRNVLGVWDENWDFANEICDLLNSLEDDPHIFLTEIHYCIHPFRFDYPSYSFRVAGVELHHVHLVAQLEVGHGPLDIIEFSTGRDDFGLSKFY